MDIVIKQEQMHQDIDQSDVSSEPSVDDAFAWAYSTNIYDTHAGDSVWKSSEDIQWQEGRKCARLKPFSGVTGVNLHFETDSPMDFFHMFVPKSIFSIACKETNNYVDFYQDQKRDQGKEWWDWTDSTWNPVEDEEEMRKFLGICMVMSVKKLPHPQYYWSSHDHELKEDLVAEAMSANRFSKLMQYFYLSNPWRDPERIANPERRAEACLRDPLYKLSNSLLPSFLEANKAMYSPNQYLILRQRDTLDKSKGLEQNQSSDLWKVLTVEDASTGFITNSLFHRVDACNTMTPSESDIREILSDLEEKSHVVYADSVFISPQTSCHLVARGIHVSANDSAWPSEFDEANIAPLSSDVRLYRHYKDVTVTSWKSGSKIRRHLTSFEDKSPVTDEYAKSSIDFGIHRDSHNATFSHVVGENASKKRLDEDGYLLSNSTLLSQMSKANWKKNFWTLIDMALNNASILWNESGRVPFTLSEFTMEIARGLILDEFPSEHKHIVRSSRPVPLLPPQPVIIQPASPLSALSAENANSLLEEATSGLLFNSPTMVPINNVEHALVKFPGRGRNCRQCMVDQTRTRGGRRRDTQFGCDVCGINLCRAACFAKYHALYNLKINQLSMTQIAKLDFQPPAKRTRPSMVPADFAAQVLTTSSPSTATDARSDDASSNQ